MKIPLQTKVRLLLGTVLLALLLIGQPMLPESPDSCPGDTGGSCTG